VGLTVVEPLADVDVKLPGVMAILVALVVVQARVLLVPVLIVAGVVVNDVILGVATVTVAFAVDEPAGLVAVKV